MKILKTYSGDKFEIDDDEADEVLRVIMEGKQKGIAIHGNYIATSSIAGVIKSDDDDVPDGGYLPETREQYALNGTVEQHIAKSEKASAGLLEGLKKYCDEHPEAKKAKASYDEKSQARVRRHALQSTTAVGSAV